MRCDGNGGNPFPAKQGNRPSSRAHDGEMRLLLKCARTLRAPPAWGLVFRRTSSVAGRVGRTLERFKWEGVISLVMLQQKRAPSRLQGRTSWFFSSCGRSLSSYDGDFRDPLVCPQERPVSKRVARGPSGFLSSQCRVLGTCLELQPELEVSSPVLLCILGFLWSLHRRVRTLLKWRHARPFFYQA